MTQHVEFRVPGIPRPGGSKRAFIIKGKNGAKPRAIVTEACKTSKDWRASVKLAATEAMEGKERLIGPLLLRVWFMIDRPRAHYVAGKRDRGLKKNAPDYPTTKPDSTKLLRSTEDAMTGIVWYDDAQIVTQTVRKRYAGSGDPVGALIIVCVEVPGQ